MKLPDRGWWGGWGPGVREVTDSLPAYRGTPTKMELSTGRGGAGWLGGYFPERGAGATSAPMHRGTPATMELPTGRVGVGGVEGPGPGGGGGGSPVCRRRVGGVDVGGVTSPVVVVVGPGAAHRSLPFKGAKPCFALSADAHLCLHAGISGDDGPGGQPLGWRARASGPRGSGRREAGGGLDRANSHKRGDVAQWSEERKPGA